MIRFLGFSLALSVVLSLSAGEASARGGGRTKGGGQTVQGRSGYSQSSHGNSRAAMMRQRMMQYRFRYGLSSSVNQDGRAQQPMQGRWMPSGQFGVGNPNEAVSSQGMTQRRQRNEQAGLDNRNRASRPRNRRCSRQAGSNTQGRGSEQGMRSRSRQVRPGAASRPVNSQGQKLRQRLRDGQGALETESAAQ
jgi:hypothetical protein